MLITVEFIAHVYSNQSTILAALTTSEGACATPRIKFGALPSKVRDRKSFFGILNNPESFMDC